MVLNMSINITLLKFKGDWIVISKLNECERIEVIVLNEFQRKNYNNLATNWIRWNEKNFNNWYTVVVSY